MQLTFGEEVKVIWTDGKREEYAVVFGPNMGFRDGTVKPTMIVGERERHGECEVYLLSINLVPIDSVPQIFNVKFELDNGMLNFDTDAIVIAGSPEMASVKLKNYVNSLNSETCCRYVHSVEAMDTEVIILP